MSIGYQNAFGAGYGGFSSRPAHVLPATTQPAQVLPATTHPFQFPHATARQRDWAYAEAKEWAERQDLIVSETWPKGTHRALLAILDLADDAWDEKNLDAREYKIRRVVALQRQECGHLMSMIYRERDRVRDVLGRYKADKETKEAAAGQGPAEDGSRSGGGGGGPDPMVQWCQLRTGSLQNIYNFLAHTPAHDELCWNRFYDAHRRMLVGRRDFESIRDELDSITQPQKPPVAAESAVQQNGHQVDDQMNDQVNDQMDDQMDDEIYDEMDDQVNGQNSQQQDPQEEIVLEGWVLQLYSEVQELLQQDSQR